MVLFYYRSLNDETRFLSYSSYSPTTLKTVVNDGVHHQTNEGRYKATGKIVH